MEEHEKAPAKINLCLNVLGKREDGFHDMEMIMTTIDLSDRLSFSLQESEITLHSNSSAMPLDKRNIVYKTAALLKKTYEVEEGAHIYIEKVIPIAAGLGGGSTDAAATLRALNRLWKLDLSLEELAHVGEEIGSDVPFCVYGKTAYVTGRGERVQPIAPFQPCWVIVVKPPKGISSWTVFQDLNVEKLPQYPIHKMVDAINAGSYKESLSFAGNALEEKAKEQNAFIEVIKDRMHHFGADITLMSGTGPTVFGLTQHYSKAKKIVNGLKGFCKEVYLVRSLK